MLGRKQKECYFSVNNIQYIDYKDTQMLRRFITGHGKLLSARRTGTKAKYQRKLARAVKRARFMGLLPYVAH
jgi:small subunit ribosomal protein S18